VIDNEENLKEDEKLVVERLEDNCEDYMTNQVLPLVPDKENQLKLTKKFAKVFKLYSSYKIKKIRKKNVIKTKPIKLTKSK